MTFIETIEDLARIIHDGDGLRISQAGLAA